MNSRVAAGNASGLGPEQMAEFSPGVMVVDKVEQVVEQTIAILMDLMSSTSLSSVSIQSSYTTRVIKEMMLDYAAGMDPADIKAVSKKINAVIKTCPDKMILLKALQCVGEDELMTSEIIQKLLIKILDKKEKSWSGVLSLFCLFFCVLQRLNINSIKWLVEQVKVAFRQHLVTWILQQGGWMKLESVKPYHMKQAIEYLLSCGEHFLVFLYERADKVTKKLVDEIMSYLSGGRARPVIFEWGDPSFGTLSEEIQFYKKYPNAVFVVFLTSTAAKNKELLPCFEAVREESLLCHSGVIPVEIFGVKSKDLPSCLKKYKSIRAISECPWRTDDVHDLVKMLISQFESLIHQELLLNLAPKTELQLDIQLNIQVHASLPQPELSELTIKIKGEAKSLLEDPWTQIRQHLLHLYKVKNMKVIDKYGSNYIILELVMGKPSEIEMLLVNYKSKKLILVLEKYLKLPDIKHSFSWSVYIDESRADQVKKTLQSTFVQLQDMTLHAYGLGAFASGKNTSWFCGLSDDQLIRKARVVGGLVKNIVERKAKYYPYDLYAMLFKKRDEMDLALVKNEKGLNVLHIIVEAGRPEYLDVPFYLNLWDQLRMDLTEPVGDLLYAGYTPRGLAEKLLYKSSGPAVLEEYNYFDDLWMQMPHLHKACLRGCLTYVEVLLSTSSTINECDQSGATCVLYACSQGSVGIVRLLIERGADPTLVNGRGENGLIMASKFSKCHVVRLLLSRFTFDQHHSDHAGNRALDYVAMNGDIQTLNAFIDGGVSPDKKMVAVASGYGRDQMVVHLATKCGVNCSGVDDNGRTPLLNAAASNNETILSFLYDLGVDLICQDEQNRNCFHLVAESNHQAACQYLVLVAQEQCCLKKLINERDFYSGSDQLVVVRGREHGQKVWHYVAIKRTLAYLYEVKKSSGHIDVKDFGNIVTSGSGRNPSKEVIHKYRDKLMETLKKCQPDMTPLFVAAWKNQTEVALLLLSAGANPNITDYFGSTPLHMAAVWGNLDLACALEKHGVDLDMKNAEKETALDVAEANGQEAIMNFINGKQYFEHAKKVRDFLKETKQKLSDEQLRNLRSRGVDIRRHLISAARDLKIEAYKILLDMNSGPVMEESRNTANLPPADFKCEFAGNELKLIRLPHS